MAKIYEVQVESCSANQSSSTVRFMVPSDKKPENKNEVLAELVITVVSIDPSVANEYTPGQKRTITIE